MRFAGLGFELIGPIVLLAYVGYRLDRWLETRPWFLAGGLLLGIVVSMVGFFRRVWPTQNDGGETKP
jgi:F0F1-type ATP synthase assembly protein I